MLKQALVSLQSDSPFRELEAKRNSDVTVIECKYHEPRDMTMILELRGRMNASLEKDLREVHGMKQVALTQNGQRRAHAMVTMDAPLYCEIVHRSRAFCKSCPYNDSSGDESRWSLLVKDEADLMNFVEGFERHDIGVKLIEMTDAAYKYVLTPRQKEMVRKAIELGYFEFPRRVSLTELALALSVRSSTLSESLRRAEQKMARNFVDSELRA